MVALHNQSLYTVYLLLRRSISPMSLFPCEALGFSYDNGQSHKNELKIPKIEKILIFDKGQSVTNADNKKMCIMFIKKKLF